MGSSSPTEILITYKRILVCLRVHTLLCTSIMKFQLTFSRAAIFPEGSTPN